MNMMKAGRPEFAIRPRLFPPANLAIPAPVSMIGKVLPPIVAFCDRPDEASLFDLHPEEQHAVEARQMPLGHRAQFERGRRCARAAMDKLGRLDLPVSIDGKGAPIWPAGLVGSITHAPDYCAAAIARIQHFRAIGINAEAWQQFPTDIAEDISVPQEIGAIEPSIDMRLKLGVLFSAKRSIFKALSPIIHRDFDFRAVLLKVDFGDRSFRIVSVDSHDLDRLKSQVRGEFSVSRKLILTSALLHNS